MTKIIAEENKDRVDFHPDKFKKKVDQKGYLVEWYKSTICPCRKESTSQAVSNCINCNGRGFYFFDSQQIRGTITSATNSKNFVNWSEIVQGSAYFTTAPENKIGWFDKIVVLDGKSVFSEVCTVKNDGANNYIELKYDPVNFVKAYKYVNPDTSIQIIENSKLTIDTVISNKVKISTGVSVTNRVTINYLYNPTYLVIDLLNDYRNTRVKDGYPEEVLKEMPVRAMIKKTTLGKILMGMINLNIDVAPIVQDVLNSKAEVDRFIDFTLSQTANRIREQWREEASRGLGSTRKQYKNAVLPVEMGNKVATIRLVGALPNMLESGASPFDIKTGMLKSNKVKYTKNGKPYMTVPFRHGTPDALAEDESFSGNMPEDIYELMKDRPATRTVFGNDGVTKSTPLQHGELPERFQGEGGLGMRETIQATDSTPAYGAYQHKTNVNQGMVRYEQMTSAIKQSTYVTFRRISLSSDPMSWIHRGFTARRFADKAVQSINLEDSIENDLRVFING